MPFLKEQIDIINEALRKAIFVDKRFAGMQLHGLANLVTYKEGEAIKTAPVVMDKNYEPQFIGLDDTYPAIIYHRAQSLSYNSNTNNAQFGRGVNKVVQVADMMLVIYGRFARLKITAEQFEALIVSGFPDEVASEELVPYKLDNMLITLQSSNMLGPQVYAGEYGGPPVVISAEDILFAVRYRIETAFRKNCFSICDCPNQEAKT